MSWVEGLLGDILQIYLDKTCGHGWHDLNIYLYGLINVRLDLDLQNLNRAKERALQNNLKYIQQFLKMD